MTIKDLVFIVSNARTGEVVALCDYQDVAESVAKEYARLHGVPHQVKRQVDMADGSTDVEDRYTATGDK